MTRRKTVAIIAVALLAITAGCAGIIGDDGNGDAEPDDNETDPDTNETNSTDTNETNESYANVSEDWGGTTGWLTLSATSTADNVTFTTELNSTVYADWPDNSDAYQHEIIILDENESVEYRIGYHGGADGEKGVGQGGYVKENVSDGYNVTHASEVDGVTVNESDDQQTYTVTIEADSGLTLPENYSVKTQATDGGEGVQTTDVTWESDAFAVAET